MREVPFLLHILMMGILGVLVELDGHIRELFGEAKHGLSILLDQVKALGPLNQPFLLLGERCLEETERLRREVLQWYIWYIPLFQLDLRFRRD